MALVVSGVDAAVLPGRAPATAPSKAVNPRDVPLLPSAPPAKPAVAAPKPNADFGPLSSRSGQSHFDAHRSVVVSRSMFTDEYRNPDGTHTFKESSGAPMNVKDASGAWQPVDTGLTTDTSGRV